MAVTLHTSQGDIKLELACDMVSSASPRHPGDGLSPVGLPCRFPDQPSTFWRSPHPVHTTTPSSTGTSRASWFREGTRPAQVRARHRSSECLSAPLSGAFRISRLTHVLHSSTGKGGESIWGGTFDDEFSGASPRIDLSVRFPFLLT